MFLLPKLLGHVNLTYFALICSLSVVNLFKLYNLSVDGQMALQQNRYENVGLHKFYVIVCHTTRPQTSPLRTTIEIHTDLESPTELTIFRVNVII